MDYQRIRDFILSYSRDDEGILGDIYKEAVSQGVPIIRKEARDLLVTLLHMNRPERVLEIGTAVGYSTLVIARTLDDMYSCDKTYLCDETKLCNVTNSGVESCRDVAEIKWHIDTCEMDKDRISQARKNISLMSMNERISLYEGDAEDILDGLYLDGNKCVYDFIFIDAAKAQYMSYLDKSLNLSHNGTVIVTDNILADGDVLESHFLVEKRDRTIHDRMREYLYRIKNDKNLETAILSVADGMAVSVVRDL